MALKDVGVRLTVQGLSGFKSSMRSAEDSIGGIGTKLQNLDPQIRQAGMAMAGLGASITAAFTVSALKAMDFEQAITNAVSVTGYMGDEAEVAKEKMSDLARELGSTTKFTASQVAQAMYDLASKGFKPAEMSIEELQPFLDLAAATQADLAQTTETVTSTLRAFGLQTTESGRVSDVFAKTIGSSAATIDKLSTSMAYVAPVAKAANMSLEETSAFLGALYNTGLDASMAGTALRGVLAELMDPSDELSTIVAGLGGYTEDAAEAQKKLTDANAKLATQNADYEQKLSELNPKLNIMNQELDIAIEKYGESSIQVQKKQLAISNLKTDISDYTTKIAENNVVMDSNSKSLKSITDGLENATITMADLDLNTNSVTDILKKLKKEGMTNAQVMAVFGKRAGPAALSLMGVNEAGVDTLDTITELTGVLENAGDTAENMAEMQLDTTQGKLTILKSAFEDLMITIGDALLPVINSLVSVIQAVLVPIGQWMKDNPALTEIIVIFGTALGVLLTALGAIVVIGPSVAAAFSLMLGPVGLVIIAIEAIIVAVVLLIKHWDDVVAVAKWVWEKVSGYFKGLWKDITKIWDGIWEIFRGFRNQLQKWFVDKIIAYVDLVKSVWGGLLDFFKNLWDGILNVGKTTINSVINLINKAIGLVSGKQLLHMSKKVVAGVTVFPEVTIKLPTIPKIPTLAAGGDILAGGSAIVGERGPELLNLPTGAMVQPLTNNYEYNITENYARPESPQSLDLSLQALAMLSRT